MPIKHDLGKIVLQHPKGPSAEVLLYGATIVSWTSPISAGAQPTERLFVSAKAALDGTKPVRGGIPVVFPCFGAPTHPDHAKLSQHGFGRNQVWKFDGVVLDNQAGVSVRLTLEPNPEISAKYTKAFHLAYVVTLAEHQLSTDLHVTNTSVGEDLEFQALLHNYFHVPSKDVSVGPLKNLNYYDKTEATDEARATAKVESRDRVDVKAYTDSVYDSAPGEYDITWPAGHLHISTKNFKDVVVWNPQAEAGSKIGDMEAGGWDSFVCVEPGIARGFEILGAGKTWVGQQVISVKL
ncbi:hypothetical protein HGRIS_007906 [Hohenbuehelia grisea]|uniref:Glucose-6-phosphate 1-epimerase n=1 Tax=Hohenbuehelia grisea TaxID=104357 RepID=A0ABR3J7P0_9AGAR